MQNSLKDLTLSELQGLLQRAKETGLKRQAREVLAIPVADRTKPIPTSFAQQRLWYLAQSEGVSQAYHMPMSVPLSGELDHSVLRRALDRVTARHEILRTTFAEVGEIPFQKIASEDTRFSLTEYDLRQHLGPQAELKRLAVEEASSEFDLTVGPLVRGRLIQLEETEHVLLVTMHHIVSDGWSIEVFTQELNTLYRAFSEGQPDPLPALPIQYVDYAVWQRQRITGDVLRAQSDYWKRTLHGAPALLDLPTDRPRPAQQDYSGDFSVLELDAQLTSSLSILAQTQGVTVFMTLLAAWAILLSRITQQEDIVVGTPVANRNRIETEPLIGLFVNMLALRIDLARGRSVGELLQHVKDQTVAAQENQDLPFEQVVDIVKPRRSAAHPPLFQAMFVLSNQDKSVANAFKQGEDVNTSSNDAPHTKSQFELSLFLAERGDRIVGGIEYATALFDQTTVDRYGEFFLHIVRAMVSPQQTGIGVRDVSSEASKGSLARVDELDIEWDLRLPTVVPTPAANTGDRMPLSYHQERIWFIDEFEAGYLYESSPVYHNIPLLLELDGNIDSKTIEDALNNIIARHAALRTRVAGNGAEAWLTIAEKIEIKLTECHVDSSNVVEAAIEETQKPFQINKEPLIRAALLQGTTGPVLLAVTIHHLVADRASMRLIGKELLELCAAKMEGRAPELPALLVHYPDYAVWQRQFLKNVQDALTFYWKHELRGRLQAVGLPLNRPRPLVHTFSAARHDFTISPLLTQRLKALTNDEGVSSFDVVFAGFNAFIRRYAGHDEIVVGTSAICREQPNIRHVVGPIANLLVLRNFCNRETTFRDLLRQVRRTVFLARKHQEMQFDQLVLALKPEKDMSRTALFDILFQFDEEGDDTLCAGALRAKILETNLGYGKNDLHLYLHANGDQWIGNLTYNADFFDPWLAEQMMEHYVRMLEALANDPDQLVDTAPLLSEGQERQQLVMFNDTDATYPQDKTIHQLFEEQAALTPGHIAVSVGDACLTYEELDQRANRLAHYLRSLGVTPQTRVAICLERSLDVIVAIFGIMKAGAAYVPVDPAYPAERIKFILQDSGATHLVTVDAFAGSIPSAGAQRVSLDADAKAIAAHPASNPVNVNEADHLIYVIYTSGSTGQPKGAMLEHRNVVRLLINSRLPFAFSDNDRWSMFHSYSFDFSIWEIFGALLYGGQIIIVPDLVRRDPHLSLDLILREQVTVLSQTPTAFSNLVREIFRRPEVQLPALRYVVFGGEALDPGSLKDFYQTYPHVELINMYGITETCVHVTHKRITETEVASRSNNIGKPIPTTTLYIMDQSQRLVPAGVLGEICVGGLGLARGYLGREELTCERFVSNPYRPGERLYRSGDLGKLLENGEVAYLGRMDNQVQLRGFRIELGEIQSCLVQHPEVGEAVVLVREDTAGDKRLVAYYTPADAARHPAQGRTSERNATGAEILSFYLSGLLPEYMVPGAYVALPSLPLTPNGKLDIAALPAPESNAYAVTDYESPVGVVETALAQIWADVLGVERIGRNDDFFDLDGHSLLAVRVVSRVRQDLGVEILMSSLFTYPVFNEFAEVVKNASRSDLPPISVVSREQPLALSFAQQRLWFMEQLEGASKIYNIPCGLRLNGALNTQALRKALNRILARHEALRTTFALEGDAPVQRIASADCGFALQEHDLRGHEAAEGEVERLASEEAGAPFDLQAGPLIRGRLIQLDQDCHVLLVTMHHIVSDGWSQGVLVKELSALYNAYSQGKDDPLPPLAIQYADYAAWQRRWISGEVLQKQTEYWRHTLTGAPPLLELPTDRARPLQQEYAGGFVGLELDEQLTAGLKALSQRHGTTLFMTILAAWAALLSRLSGQVDVVIGTPMANRTRAEVEPLIGFFINTLALRFDLSGNPGVSNLLERVKIKALEAQQHQDLPFEQVVDIVKPPRSMSHGPLYQVSFTWQNNEEGRLDLTGLALQPIGMSSPTATDGMPSYPGDEEKRADMAELELEPVTAASSTAKHDMSLYLGEMHERIVGGLEYATSLFDEATVARFSEYLHHMLQAMVADEQQVIDRIPLLSAAERQQLLVHWNATEVDNAHNRCVHELFEAQVERTPNAIALTRNGRQVNYSQLNAQANQLAHYLRKQGVGPDATVALCVERGFDMIVGLLGILKAGGAYVPLDPSYPAERLVYMLADSAPVALLTHGEIPSALHATLRLALTESGAPLIDLEADSGRWARLSNENLTRSENGISPDHLAYVIYTSGSTGTPKGVMVAHRGVCNLALAQIDGFAIEADSRVLQFASFSFDACVSEIVTTLVQGATLVLPTSDTVLAGKVLVEMLERERISHVTLPPVVLTSLPEDARLETVRTLVMAGEASSAALVKRYGAGRRLINAYGPTESTVCATMHVCTESDADRVPAIGRPIANTRVYLLDQHGQPVPQGVVGEIHIGGVQVARGYLNRDELTAERFLPDPFTDKPDARMYRTGDLGRYLADGSIAFLGRNDHQVKLRGFRIELGEIEAKLLAQEGVREAVVVACEDNGNKRLVAYYVKEASAETDAEALRTQLAAILPEYMLPAAYVQLDALPLTPNGKLSRNALPAPEGDAYASRAYEAPVGEIETALATIWAEVLGLEQVGRRDNFFDLGGNSLLAVKIASRMREAQLHADVRTLFLAPDLAALAAAVASESGHKALEIPPNLIPPGCTAITPDMLTLVALGEEEIASIVAKVPGGAANVQDIYPLAPLQEGILFHHLMESTGDVYLSPTLFTFDSQERLNAFLTALQAVVDRHDILRTAVQWEGLPEPVQVVWRSAPLGVEECNFDPNAGDITDQLRARFDPRFYRIDLRDAPLMRAFGAYDQKINRWVLLLLAHHLLIDHTTQEIIQQEIEAHLLGQMARLSMPQPFRNFIAQTRLSVSREEHEAFFHEMLADVSESTIPFGLADAQGDGSKIEEAWHAIDDSLSRRIRKSARSVGVTSASLFHLAWAHVLARVSGNNDVVFGTVLFGRMHGAAGADRVLGVSINTLPLRVQLQDERVDTCLRKVHTLLAKLLRHEHAPLALAQRCSAVAAPAPLFTALMNYRHSTDNAGASTDADTTSDSTTSAWENIEVKHGAERTNYPLTLNIDDVGDWFSVNVQVQSPINPNSVCAYMLAALKQLVDKLEQNPSALASEIDILSEEDRSQMLVDWNATQADYPYEQCTHELFEAQAARTPDAIAVVFEDRQLSYGELNAQANQLARHLRQLGVVPDTRVAICVERSLDMMVGLLAIMKAGGAYVPLDPTYPPERLAYMLQDSAPVVIVTHSQVAHPIRNVLAQASPESTIVDLDTASWSSESDANLKPADARVAPTDLAYVIYTSGSTGQPKGVMLEHRGVVNLLCSMQSTLGVASEDRMLALTTIAFDIAGLELYLPLICGARVVLASRLTGHDPHALEDIIEQSEITVMQATPATWRMLLDAEWNGKRSLKALCGGEALPTELSKRLIQRVGKLWNVYGPTETTIWSTAADAGMQDTQSASQPIGRPIANTRVYLLDAHCNPVPVGVTGAIYIAGHGVARGYFNQPALTAERFVADPFSNQPGARMYRTGDLGRYLLDGTIEFLGRDDFQVKIRGFRIELGEIEAALQRHSSVGEAVALALDEGGEPSLAVFIVPDASEGIHAPPSQWNLQPDSEDDADKGGLFSRNDPRHPLQIDLRTHAAKTLPVYMLPAIYTILDSMPLTNNGKIDRLALRSLACATQASPERQEPPIGELELAVAETFSEVLKQECKNRGDSFFLLGGHSLLAVKAITILKRKGIEVSVADLFKHPTVAGLAENINRAGENRMKKGIIPVRTVGSERPLFLIHENTGVDLWFALLAQHISDAMPVYGLTAVPLGEKQLHTIEGMAARHIRTMRSVQPTGPYRVAGWSLGGLLAYEVAAQLLGQDEVVEFVGLIDVGKPEFNGERSEPLTPQTYLLDLVEGVARKEALTEDQHERVSALRKIAATMSFEEVFERAEKLGLLHDLFDGIRVEEVHQYVVRLIAHETAAGSYSAQPVPLRVHLFTAQEQPGMPAMEVAKDSSSLGWTKVVAPERLEVSVIPGNHQSILDQPHVRVLGAAITQAIETAAGLSWNRKRDATSNPVTWQAIAEFQYCAQVTIHTGAAAEVPVFCIPGAGDNVIGFIALANALGSRWPLYGLQPRGVEGSLVPHTTVEAAAAAYVREIEKLKPDGFVHLIGHSFGGWMAFEIAQQLCASGRTVASLTIVDSEAPEGSGILGAEYTALEALKELVRVMEIAAGKSLNIDMDKLDLQTEAERLATLHAGIVSAGLMPARSSADAMRGPLRTFSTALRTTYKPRDVFPGSVRLALATDSRLEAQADHEQRIATLAGWKAWAPQVSCWHAPGNHFTVLKPPHVHVLADWWRAGAGNPGTKTP